MTQRYHPYDPADPKPATMYPEAKMAPGKKVFTFILGFAALIMAGFSVWLYDHPLKSTEKIVYVPAACPACPICPPAKSGAATTKGTQSPAITGSGNPVTYGTPPLSEPKKPQN